MARIAFEKIMAGLEDALAYAEEDVSKGTAHQVEVTAKPHVHERHEIPRTNQSKAS